MIEDGRKVFFVIDEMTDNTTTAMRRLGPRNNPVGIHSTPKASDVVVDRFLSEGTWMFIDRERSQLDPYQPSSVSPTMTTGCGDRVS